MFHLSIDASHLENKEKEYWYGNLMQSVYLCFRSLRIQGLMQVKLDYFFELVKYTSDCLNKLREKNNVQVFVTFPCISFIFLFTHRCYC